MDPVSSAPPPASANRNSNSHKTLKRIAIIAVVIALIVTIVELGIAYFSDKESLLGDGRELIITSVQPPIENGAIAVNISEGSSGELYVDTVGTGNIVSVAYFASSTPSYLVGDKSSTSTNLFSGIEGLPGLAQLTDSQTLKYDLSVDPASGRAAYTAVTQDSPHIYVYDPTFKIEIDLGVGSEPTLLPGGSIVIFRSGSNLVSQEVEGATQRVLRALEPGAAFSVDAGGMRIALYNPNTSEVETYLIEENADAGPLSSVPAPGAPKALLISPKDLFALIPVNDEGTPLELHNLNKPSDPIIVALPPSVASQALLRITLVDL